MSDLKVGRVYKNINCALICTDRVRITKLDDWFCYFFTANGVETNLFKANFIRWFTPDKEYNVKRILECLK